MRTAYGAGMKAMCKGHWRAGDHRLVENRSVERVNGRNRERDIN